MIAKLNLASQPFRNRTLPWTITVVVSCVSILLLLFTFSERAKTRAQADRVENDLVSLRKERAELEARNAQVRQSVPPDQMKSIEAAHLLVDRKRFSWSKLFVDLESSLPNNVRVSRISVRDVSQRGGQTRGDLEMVVVGRASTDVTGMITEMNRTGIFSATPVSEKVSDEGIEWTLRVNYLQQQGAPAKKSEESDAANIAASSTVAQQQ